MKIYYLYHSCFAIETKNYKLIFDYFKLPNENIGDFSLEDFLKGDKPILVFSSHSHSDHFNKDIFNWNGNITYILSDDIVVAKKEKNIIFVKKGDSLEIDEVKINIFGSTDLGVSFLVSCDGDNFFHCGDLNWWCWNDDTKEEYQYMKNLYFSNLQEIKNFIIKNHIKEIDYLFFPVDPRLEENYSLGVEYFIKNIDVKNIICMHFWNDFSVINKIKEKFNGEKISIIPFNKNLTEIV